MNSFPLEYRAKLRSGSETTMPLVAGCGGENGLDGGSKEGVIDTNIPEM